MAIHPGNITAVWPPSGIALAALLIGGNRLWPGIWLGSFLANTLVFKGFEVAPADFAVGASIGVGSVLQAVAGAEGLRWWIGVNDPLGRAVHVFRFVLVAMVMCVISATVWRDQSLRGGNGELVGVWRNVADVVVGGHDGGSGNRAAVPGVDIAGS